MCCIIFFSPLRSVINASNSRRLSQPLCASSVAWGGDHPPSQVTDAESCFHSKLPSRTKPGGSWNENKSECVSWGHKHNIAGKLKAACFQQLQLLFNQPQTGNDCLSALSRWFNSTLLEISHCLTKQVLLDKAWNGGEGGPERRDYRPAQCLIKSIIIDGKRMEIIYKTGCSPVPFQNKSQREDLNPCLWVNCQKVSLACVSFSMYLLTPCIEINHNKKHNIC